MTEDTSTPPSQTAPIMVSDQPLPQTIVITRPKKSSRKVHFKDRFALIIGIILITSASVAIVVGGFGYWTFLERMEMHYHGHGHGHNGFVPFWTAPVMYILGAFAIVSAKTKSRGFIITTMVFSIIAAVFAVPLICTSSWIVSDEKFFRYISPYSTVYSGNWELITASPDDHERAVSLQKGGLAVGVFLLLCGLVEFCCSIVLSALCCRVLCCGRSTDSSQVVYLSSPPGVTSMANPGQVSTYSANAPQASGGELPPPYSEPEIVKVSLGEAEAGACPTKAPLPGL